MTRYLAICALSGLLAVVSNLTPSHAEILPPYIAYPPKITQQVTAQDICFARWVWNDEDLTDPFWEAPFRADLVGSIDLRSLPQMAQAGGSPEGWGLFAYDQPMGASGMHCVGGDLDSTMTAPQVNTLALMLGKEMGDFRARNMRGLIKEIFTEDADPTGQAAWKPVVISRKTGFRVVLGGYGVIVDEPFSQRHPGFQPTLDVRWADYRRHKAAGVDLETLRKWTGHDSFALFGRLPTDGDLALLLPPEHRGDRSERPSTTLTDTFTDTDSTTLDAHTPTPSGGFTWATPTCGFEVATNQIVVETGAEAECTGRASASLSSADHYAQIDATVFTGSSRRYAGPTIRYAAAAETYYIFRIHNNNSTWANEIRHVVAGSATTILSSTSTNYNGAATTAYLEIVGSTLDAKVGGVSLGIGGTDTTITGNLQVGLSGRHSTSIIDNWEGADFAVTPRRIIRAYPPH